MTETTEILKERGKRYGRFDGHADVTQRLKQVIATELHIRRKELANDQQEALDMICHKIGRIINGDADYEDSWRDIAGYAQLVADRLLEPGKNEGNQEKCLKPESPEPILPNGWIRPSKAYPQVAEDPSTRWQYIYDGERWLRLVKPIHEMSEKELKHLDMGGDFPYPIVFPPELNRFLPYLPNGWKFHQRTLDSQHAAIMADDESGHQHVWMDGCWMKP